METINTLFAQAVEHNENRPALLEPVGGNEISTLTYRQVQERAHRFAGYLQEMHIESGNRILIWSASRIDWMVAYLGILLLGAVAVPQDINTREDFLVRVAETTEAKLLITTQKQYESLKTSPLPLVDIDALPQGTLDPTRLPVVNADDLAELVFTSGTTGQPKGVMLTHKNISSNAIASVEAVGITSADRTLSILPLSHMFEMTIEIAVFYAGASNLYARSLVPETLLKLLGTNGITCMVLVPQALQLFLHGIEREVRRQKREKQWELLNRIAARLPFCVGCVWFLGVHRRFGGKFRFFVSGGAYLPPKLAERWENMGFRVLQGYGATECAPVISATRQKDHIYDSVGKTLPGVEIRIAEDNEILVRGPNVAKGYWKNPEATSVAFQAGWYHTGDLGFLDEQGNLHLKGRKKNLIVLANGMNVYPEDLENVLITNPIIKDAAVFGVMQKDQGPEVHAVLLMDDADKAKSAIQQANKQLAPHQQIRGFTVWPERDFPRTHTLKVKRMDVLTKLQELQSEAR